MAEPQGSGSPAGLVRLGALMNPRSWRRDPSLPPFSGWRIVAMCCLLQMMSGPGQTLGVSVFIDPMIEGLELSRSQVSSAYLVGTLAGALGLPAIGRYLDAQGARRATAIVAVMFGLVLVGMSGVRGLVTLTLGFIGIRMLGQGGLTVIASAAPAHWFDRRRGLAIGITTSIGSAATALIPLASTIIILTFGWRRAWIVLAVAVWVVLLAISRWGLIDKPADVGQYPDGIPPMAADGDGSDDPSAVARSGPSFTNAQAMRTPIYWSVMVAVVTASMITTSLNFHQISILGEQGLTPLEAAANFVPQTIAGLLVSLYIGNLIDKLRQRFLLAGMLLVMMMAMASVSLVQPGLLAIMYGIILGCSQGAMRSIESASFLKLFGAAHAGEIRGVARAISVAASALGPLALAFGFDLTGSYRQILLLLLPLPAAAIVFAVLAPEPPKPPVTVTH